MKEFHEDYRLEWSWRLFKKHKLSAMSAIINMKRWVLILLAIASPIFCFSQVGWELKRNEDGIAVYTRRLNNERYKEVKVICETSGSAERLIQILQDVNHHKDWVYGTKISNILSRKNEDTILYYTEIDLPWPASNRDLVVQLSVSKISSTTSRIEARSMPEMLPVKPNLIRVPYSRGIWTVTTLPNKRIKIEYEFSVNPGGSLPAWLVNSTAKVGPFNSFKNLKKMLK